jgi:hypothetical protein
MQPRTPYPSAGVTEAVPEEQPLVPEAAATEKRRYYPRIKGNNMPAYRIARIMEKQHCTEEEAMAIVKSQDRAKFTSSTRPKRNPHAQKKRTTYVTNGRVVTSVVSGGGGPGTGKKK